MEANKQSDGSFLMINDAYTKIQENRQREGLQNDFNGKQKTQYEEKLEDSKNKGKWSSLNGWNVHNGKQKKKEIMKNDNQLALQHKKQTNFTQNLKQIITENSLKIIGKNCQNLKSKTNSNSQNSNLLNSHSTLNSNQLNYNNFNVCTKINFQSHKKFIPLKQPLFIPQKQTFQNQKIIQLIQKQHLQMFIKGQEVIYPVPDHLLKVTPSDNNKDQIQKATNVKDLPMGFCQIIELLNLSYLFPQKFNLELETIDKLNQIIQATSLSKDCMQNKSNCLMTAQKINELLAPTFVKYFKHLSLLLIEDLTTQKLQSITNSFTYNVLSLTKFCLQNQLLQFVFEYNWPLIIHQIAQFHRNEHQETLQNYNKSIIIFKDHIHNLFHEHPQSFSERFFIISMLIDCYSRTTSFRDLFNKKTETSRNVNKKKTNLQEQKKQIELKIKKLLTNHVKKQKKITKNPSKKNKKQINEQDSQDDDNNIPQNNNNLFNQQQSIQKMKQRLEQINQEIQKQNRQDSLSTCHYLGKDRDGQLYWYVTFFNDKLFIQRGNVWRFIGIQNIKFLLQSLQRKGIEQNRLYGKITEYYSSIMTKCTAKMQIQPQENVFCHKQSNIFQSSSTLVQKNGNTSQGSRNEAQNEEIEQQNDSNKNSQENNQLQVSLGSFKIDKTSLIKMIEVGEKKMTQYLKDRNSRWGTDQNKHLLFTTLASNQQNWLQQAKRQISLFNQKICVVEIQYKVFVEQSVQQVDSKIKKIQTKIWGINEKYKHNWYDFINNCASFAELFFAVCVLYSLIKKYTSKQRKLRKQYEEVKLKSVWKTTPAPKQWKQQWNQQCQVCGSNGQVLCCDYCPKVYHLQCINLTLVPETEYKCKSCKEQITTRNQFKLLTNSKKKNRR